ncbi:MAG TPA: ribosome biogenesis GTPase Der [Steroidobacteraceae bacterium]|nr:ribosome biogenesis GTPase Der [Steroidobacteraceae bacterium]
MLPVVALVGRPNVGKSTLFNVLTRTRDALVADEPGLTRDRKYGFGRIGRVPYIVVDTGGLIENPGGLQAQMADQTLRAVEEADRVVLVVDAREGLTPADEFAARSVRRSGKSVVVAVNKSEGREESISSAEFHALGLGDPVAVAAAHGRGVEDLMDVVLEGLQEAHEPAPAEEGIRVAVIGRPNVGKSTLINRLLGEERVIASEEPGTTRDTVRIPFERDGVRYTLMDTAGVRRRARVGEAVEKFSVIKTLQAIDSAHVVIALIDAQDSVAEQDASLLGIAAERGRALVIGVNKWDALPPEQRELIRSQLQVRLPFVDFAPLHFISARHGSGVGELMQSVHAAYVASMREIATPELTRTLEAALEAHQPPLVRGRRIKLRYAHQGGRNPPLIVIHGNQTRDVPEAYRRYLVNVFRKTYHLDGTPVRIEFRSDENPFAGRRNPLTPRQRRKRQRVMRR